MATNVTFSSLTADIQNYIERGGSVVTDPTVFNQIPRLINAAERKMCQFLKLLGQIEVLTDPTGLQASLPVISKPDRWRETVSINYGTGSNHNNRKTLWPRSYEYCRAYWPDDSVIDATNPPQFYAEYDLNHWLIAPTPDQNYPLEIIAYMQPVLLDSVNQTNFWTSYTPNLLLYASLLEASPFLKADDRIAVWQGLMEREIQTLDTQDLQRIMDRGAQRRMV